MKAKYSKQKKQVNPMSKLIDGKLVAESVKQEVKKEVAALSKKGVSVGLAVILVGEDEASKIYVRRKGETCRELGINSYEHILDSSITQSELLSLIEKLNKEPSVNGILCQLPLPNHIDKNAVISAIDPIKDVDGFNPQNVGKMFLGQGGLLPCTPAGILKLLEFYNIQAVGKHCVIVGRSDIVGKPLSALLIKQDATVTVCHSKTKNLEQVTRMADILISATGKAGLITADMVKENAVIIDVGMNRENGRLCGDVDFINVGEKVSHITPVPGGVGPMTIAMLMQNTVNAAKMQNGIDV